MTWRWTWRPPIIYRARRASPVVESTADFEVQVALAQLAQAQAELRAACLRKSWGEELREAEERVQDAQKHVWMVRRRRILEDWLRKR
jgi:N-acetylmuramic acid 6-phosphate (MurNAc-6-P) etherase